MTTRSRRTAILVAASTGQFSDSAVQATYDQLLAQGQAGQAAALRVGLAVEQTDIADLTTALNGLTAPDVMQPTPNCGWRPSITSQHSRSGPLGETPVGALSRPPAGVAGSGICRNLLRRDGMRQAVVGCRDGTTRPG